jgi:hypothetical protein
MDAGLIGFLVVVTVLLSPMAVVVGLMVWAAYEKRR